MILISIIGAILPALWLIKYFTEADQFPEPRETIQEVFWGGVKVVFGFITVMPLMALWQYLELDKTLPVVIAAGVSIWICSNPRRVFQVSSVAEDLHKRI